MNGEQLKAIENLIELSKNLNGIDIEDIKDIITKSIQKIPITTAILHKGTYIDRIRINPSDALFTKEDDVSYIKDKKIIENKLVEFGRANKPHQPMFYGAIESSAIQMQRATAVFETCTMIRDPDSINLEGQLVTMSRWEVLEDMFVSEIVFSDTAISNNPDVKKSFDNHFGQICNHPLRELSLRFLKFISEEFSKPVNNHHDYKISAAFADLLLHERKGMVKINGKTIEGIAYPSVASECRGLNVVFRPDTVDSKMKLKLVATLKIHKNQKQTFVNNHKMVSDLGINNSNFVWIDSDPAHVLSYEQIMKQIGKTI